MAHSPAKTELLTTAHTTLKKKRMRADADPVALRQADPGRVKSYHLKDWSPDKEKGYKVLLGEGSGNWRQILEAADTIGGVDHYLTEPRCLETLRQMQGTPA